MSPATTRAFRAGTATRARRAPVLALCGTMLLCSLENIPAQNLVTNPGFESGTTGWFGGNITTNTSSPYAGTANGVATLAPFAIVYQSLLGVMPPGRTYFFSGAFKSSSPSPTSLTVFLFQTDAAGFRSTTIATGAISTAWAHLSGTFSLVTTGALTELTLSIQNTAIGSTITLSLDEILVTNTTPNLKIALLTNLVAVSWPTSATGYSPELTTNLALSATWSAVTNHLQTNSGTLVYTSAPSRSAFFRLKHP